MSTGSLNIVLHAHLPYVKHPDQPDHIEERWLYEAIAASYVPLLSVLYSLYERGVNCHVTISVSPTLCIMFRDGDLRNRFELYIYNIIALLEHECAKKRRGPEVRDLSIYYLKQYREILRLYREKFEGDLLSAFVRLAEAGAITLITTSATHAYLPILEDSPSALRAQIRGGIEIFEKLTGIKPLGFWLPECGYTPGVERILKREGVRYSFLESHGLVFARPGQRACMHRPVAGASGIVLFGRDSGISRLIWSAESGYPADEDYREFHRDLVHELTDDEVKRFVHPDGLRPPSSVKYWKVTGNDRKEIYHIGEAQSKARIHARDFVQNVSMAFERSAAVSRDEPVITIAFDAELFGHWWYEGTYWLEQVLTELSRTEKIEQPGPEAFLNDATLQQVTPESSSWGRGGYSDTWINPNNDWMLKYIHCATERMIETAGMFKKTGDPFVRDALNMAARETLMMQGSDWAFILNQEASRSYVADRFLAHYARVMDLLEMVTTGNIMIDYLEYVKEHCGEFVDVDYRWFCIDNNE